MGLHRAAELAVDRPHGIQDRFCPEPLQPTDCGNRAKCAGRRRTEKTHPALRGNADMAGDVDAQSQGQNEFPPADTAIALGDGHKGGQGHRHRVHDGFLVDAVKFRIVQLIGVGKCGSRSRHHGAERPVSGVRAATP